MRALFHQCVAVVALATPVVAASDWRLTSSEHFEVFVQSSAQTGDQRARAILTWFEQLRAFFEQPGWNANSSPPSSRVRVILFASEQEYEPYRVRATADAYYLGSDDQDYIVMTGGEAKSFPVAAHEYAHVVLRTSGSKLPPWLKEGLAEVYSTLHIDDRGTEVGGPLRGRLQTLHRRDWMPLDRLTGLSDEAFQHQERAANDVFYAESWALTGMLALSPGYAAKFPRFVSAAGEGLPSLDLLTRTYERSAEQIGRDLRMWVEQGAPATVQLLKLALAPLEVQVSDVSPLAARVLLGQLLLTGEAFDRAEELFRGLAREAPDSPDVSAALGVIALHKGDIAGAQHAWKQAIDEGVSDAKLCYRYAMVADQAGLAADQIRPALERAISSQPHFDDAHYQLALLEKNAGNYEAALREFQAMTAVADARAYAYWLAVADTFNELGRRDEAQSAAQHAAMLAITASERARAQEQTYISKTDLGVRFARDATGRLILVTARMPHGQSDWNPFIEPGDDMHRVQGMLTGIECGAVTTVQVEASGHALTLTIPDLKHVQMRRAPNEFVCGPQTATRVTVDYARTPNSVSDGIIRGMEF
ncbi:MAG: tetratricopeptide repeat protein [Bryobacteraceae bacterium]